MRSRLGVPDRSHKKLPHPIVPILAIARPLEMPPATGTVMRWLREASLGHAAGIVEAGHGGGCGKAPADPAQTSRSACVSNRYRGAVHRPHEALLPREEMQATKAPFCR